MRQSKPAKELTEMPSGALVMPAESEFARAPSITLTEEKPGRVQGLDYTQWACAIIDLNAPLARVAQERARLETKGYRKAGGQPLVSGWPNPEVWVIPRAKYDENRKRRENRIRDFVANGRMTETALAREVVTRA